MISIRFTTNACVAFTLLLLVVFPAYSADYAWFGAAFTGDGTSWNDGDNWSIDWTNPVGNPPTSSDAAKIQALDWLSGYPTIKTGTSALCGGLFLGLDNVTHLPGATLTIEKNADLTTYPNPAYSNWNPGLQLGWYSDCVLNTAGNIDTKDGWTYIGNGDITNGYGDCLINITAGTIKTPNIEFNSASSNHVQLDGGILFAGAITGLGASNQTMDITAGRLVLNGDVRADIDTWVSTNHLTAYDGNGSIQHRYNTLYPNKTVVTATNDLAVCDSPKWWDSFPRIVQASDYWIGNQLFTDLYTTQQHNGTIGFNNAHNDPTWGLYGQKLFENDTKSQQYHIAGLKNISYYETFGESVSFIAELDSPSQSTDYNTVKHIFWNWQLYSGGTIVWVGVHNWFDDESFAQPYTRTHPRYGGSPMTYPDGTIATGYIGDPTDPRNSRVYDAGCSKGLLGTVNMTYSYHDSSTANGQLYIPDTGQYSGHVSYNKDTACPAWADYAYASTLMAADGGMDGMWTDNFGPWDNFGTIGYPATKNAFGEWSVAKFRDYLSENFTTTELTSMGVTDVSTFDIRDKMISIATGWGWSGSNLSDWRWGISSWLNEPIWRAYKIFKRQVATEALTNYADTVHTAAADAGTPEFLICGNANPTYNPGWARGNIDLVSSEISAGWGLGYGTRGLMIPPVGRISPAYKMARDYGTSNFVNIWFYDEGTDPDGTPYADYLHNPGACWVLYSEMLSTNTTPMFLPQYGKPVAGTPAINADFFDFISQIDTEFGKRTPIEDVGIYYSTSSILNTITPLGYYDHDTQEHQFAFLGWATALGQLQYQYTSVPEWKLEETLPDLRVLVIASSEIFDNNDVTNILTPWVQAGGLLIVTDTSGKRNGESENFDISPSGYTLAPLTGVSSIVFAPYTNLLTVGSGKVYYIRDNIGMDYYNATTAASRAIKLSNFSSAMNALLTSQPPLAFASTDTDFDDTIGITMFQDICAGKLFIDIVNYNINLATDQITNTPALTFDIEKPSWLDDKNITADIVSPDTIGSPSISLTAVPGRIQITAPSVKYFASIIIEFQLNANTDDTSSRVNLKDYAKLAEHYADAPCYAPNDWCDQTDIDLSNDVTLDDLLEIVNNWLNII